jgi:ADP-dependent NAD(P)H-hydrate dehydratase / NAD(P)H-hydrate epimerase
MNSREQLEQVVVTAEQMRQIEARIFAAGMPVAALMEKAALLTATRIQQLYPLTQFKKVGILIGPGHNGGDALVVARELHLVGYRVFLYRPIPKLKDLTAQHAQYVNSLSIPFSQDIRALQECEVIIDGLFGFGLERSLSGEIADAIAQLNRWSKPVVSIDIPSGLHTDTGEVLGKAVRATNTLCLGLWKRGFFQDSALEYIGKAQRIDFGIQESDAQAILFQSPPIRQMTSVVAKQYLPIPRPPVTHKYKQGHLLLICGSRRYAGGAILTGLGARASGVGMLSIAVPESLKSILTGHLPDALVIDCPETEAGAIASLPFIAADFSKYTLIACGPGLTPEAQPIVEDVLKAECPVILDADGLNILAQLGAIESLSKRGASTILTPHLGEFKRLLPEIEPTDRILAVQKAAAQSGAIVLFKGARTAIAHPKGSVWLIGESTPALARGGSGDVLTGLMGGLLAQTLNLEMPLDAVVATAAWWHSQAGILAAKERTELGVDAFTLSQYLVNLVLKV